MNTADTLLNRREAVRLLIAGAAWSAIGAPQFPKDAIIRTILKDLRPEAVPGSIMFHEHVSLTAAGLKKLNIGSPRVDPNNYFMEAMPLMIEEVKAAMKEGLGCAVDAGHPDIGRDIRQLRELSKVTGLHIVPVPGLGPRGLNDQATLFDANYHSLQASLKKQYSAGSSFLLAYTFSHSIDNADAGSGRNGALSSFTGDFQNRAANRASSSFDRRHRFVASYVYELPHLKSVSGAAAQAINGWSLSGLATLQSGLPFSVSDSTAATIFGATSYAQFANGKSASDAKLTGRTQDRLNRYFDTSAFGPPPAIGNGTGFGNAGRNIFVGPGQMNFDLALRKTFRFNSERQNIEFRTESFNAFNTAQFANPATAKTSTASFGVISSTVVAPRIVQFALKYQF